MSLSPPFDLSGFRPLAVIRSPGDLPPMPAGVVGDKTSSTVAGRLDKLAVGVAMLAIIAIAAGLRLHRISTWPPPHIDEVLAAVSALELEFSAKLIEPSLAHYLPIALVPQAATFELLGISIFSLRLVSVLYGVGAVACTFWAGRTFFNPATGLFAAGIFGTSHIVLAMTRFGGTGNSQAIFLSCLCLATYGQAARKGGWWWVGWGGSIGIGVYSYEGFRAFPLAIALALLLQPRLLWKVRRGIAVALITSFAIAAPLLIASATDPGKYFEESRQLSVFSQAQAVKDLYRVDSMQDVLKKQFDISYQYFFKGGNRDTQYMFRGPGLVTGTQGLIVAGLIVALIRIRRLAYRTLIFCLALGLLGNTITESPPLVPRLSLLMPGAALLMAAPLGEISSKLFRGNLVMGSLLAAVLALALLVPNYNNYFNDYRPRDVYWSWIEPNRSIGTYIRNLDPADKVYLIRTAGVWRQNGQLWFALEEEGRSYEAIMEIMDWDKVDFDWSKAKLTAGSGSTWVIAPPEATAAIRKLAALCPTSILFESYGWMNHLRTPTELQFTALRLDNLDCVPKAREGTAP